MLKKLPYLFILCSLLLSCESYDWHTKLIFEGRIVDQNGNPAEGVTVSAYVDDNYNFFTFTESEIISYTKTDGNGYYRMMFPDPQIEDDIMLLINKDKNGRPLDTNLSDIVIHNISQDNFNDYLIDFGEKRIFSEENSTDFNLSIIDDPAINAEISDVSIEGIIQQNVIDYNVAQENLFSSFSQIVYTAAENQTIVIRYTLVTYDQPGPVYTINEIPVPINNQPVAYTINY